MVEFKTFDDLREYCLLHGTDLSGNSNLSDRLVCPGFIRYPVNPIRDKRLREVVIRFPSDGKVNFKALIRDCLFEQPRVLHWFILFSLLDKTEKYSELAQEIFNIMMFIMNRPMPSGTGVEINEDFFKIKLKSVSSQFGIDLARGIAERLKTLGLVIPKKQRPLKFLISIEERVLRKPPEVRRIGVGYKDKGHLGKPGSGYDPTDVPELKADPLKVWNKLLRTYKGIFSSIR